MWLSRKNSIRPTTTSPDRRSNFNRHSFKNIDDLLIDEKSEKKEKNASNGDDFDPDHPKPKPKQKPKQNQTQRPNQPQKQRLSFPFSSTVEKHNSSIYHRVRVANQFTRSINTTRSKPSPEKSNTKHPSSANTTGSKPSHEKPYKKHPSTANTPEASSPTVKTPESSDKKKKNINTPEISSPTIKLPGSEKRVVVYMTSLGAIRPTFDACRAVRSILQGFRVAVDERDLSMDATFKEELQSIMSHEEALALPKVFIGGRYVGNADDMRQLSETGELKKLVEPLPAVSRGVCEGCGDFRFVICSDCDGSRKCYKEKGETGVFRSCVKCNKNGLVRCPTCWTNVKC